MSNFNRSVAIFVSILASVLPVLAQQSTGAISGKVTDATGAVVPNAAITITEKNTNTVRNDVTNSAGLYNAPSLPNGEYEVRVAVQGFQTAVRDATVEAGKVTSADFALTTGAGTEVLRLEAVAPLVNTEGQNVVSGDVNRETTQAIPLNGRSSLQTTALEPGVTVAAGSGSVSNGLFSVVIPGGSVGSTRHMLDGGVNNNHSEIGGIMMNVSQEIVQATQVNSLSFDPSMGIGAGGAVNTVTRSGANDFHVDGFFFYRDHNIASYPALKRSPVVTSPFFQRKDPGFYVSGPIKKNKLFFFTSYERLQQTQVVNFQTDLPSLQAMNVIQTSPLHYNWFSQRFDYHPSDKDAMFVRYTHENNYNVYGTQNEAAWFPTYNWADQSMFAWTRVLSPALVNDFRAFYAYWNNRFITYGEAPGLGPGGAGTGNNYGAAGLSCTSPVACIGSGDPSITSMIGSGVITNLGAYANGPQMHQERSAEIKDSISWQKGRHQIKFGMDLEHVNMVYRPWDNCEPACVGTYSVESTLSLGKAFPVGSFANLPSSINSTAALNSLPIYATTPGPASSGVSVGNGTWPGFYEPNVGGVNWRVQPYVGDTWKVSDSLTVNYGLEYNLETGLFPYNMPVPTYLNPILEGQTNGLPYGTGQGVPTNKKDFGPLFGIAWSPGKDKKTVIRAGAGMYWDTIATWWQMGAEAGMGPAGDGHTTLTASDFTNIFPNMFYNSSKGVVPLPVGAPLPLNALSTVTLSDFIQIIGQEVPTIEANLLAANGGQVTKGPYQYSGVAAAKTGVYIFPSHFALPHSYQTDIGIQRELSGNMVISADWVRKQGEHLGTSAFDMNHYTRISDGASPVIPQCATVPDFNPADECSNGSITLFDNQLREVYDGLLVKVQKRLSHHYTFLASYALQKQLYANASQDLYNFSATYGPNLAKQNLNISGTAFMPWGFRLTLNSNITTATPATPTIAGVDLTDTGVTSTPLYLAVPNLPYWCLNYSCGKAQLAASVASFNATVAGTKSFNGVTVPTLTLPSNYHTGAPIIDQDIRLTKEFVYKERYHLQVFGEVFNVLNIGNLTYGNLTLTSGAFGVATARVGQTSTFSSGGPRAEQFGARFNF